MGVLTVTREPALAVTPPIAPTVMQKTGVDVAHYSRETSTQRAPLPPGADVHVPAERHGRGIRFAALTAALALATVSAYFSITGMTSIFVGAFWPVIGMGVALEVGKLSAVAWLGHQRGAASWRLRAALSGLVAVLMLLNAVGCYGFLAKANIGHQVEADTAIGGRAADIEARISVQAGIVTDIDRRLSQIDGAVEKATAKGRTASAMALAEQQRKTRAELVAQRTAEAKGAYWPAGGEGKHRGPAEGGRCRPWPRPVSGDAARRGRSGCPALVCSGR